MELAAIVLAAARGPTSLRMVCVPELVVSEPGIRTLTVVGP